MVASSDVATDRIPFSIFYLCLHVGFGARNFRLGLSTANVECPTFIHFDRKCHFARERCDVEVTVVLVSNLSLTEKSGHTQGTGRRAYGTWLENSEEAMYDLYHQTTWRDFVGSTHGDFYSTYRILF
jgi:hypothetical protein